MSMLVCVLLFATFGADDQSAASEPVVADQAAQDKHVADVVDDHTLVQPRRKSYLRWVYDALGFRYAVLLPLCGCIALASAIRVVALSPRRKAMALDWIVLSLPLFIGLAGSVADFVYAWNLHSDVTPVRGPFAFSEVFVTAVESTLAGLFFSFPAYFVVSVGLPLRKLWTRKNNCST